MRYVVCIDELVCVNLIAKLNVADARNIHTNALFVPARTCGIRIYRKNRGINTIYPYEFTTVCMQQTANAGFIDRWINHNSKSKENQWISIFQLNNRRTERTKRTQWKWKRAKSSTCSSHVNSVCVCVCLFGRAVWTEKNPNENKYSLLNKK